MADQGRKAVVACVAEQLTRRDMGFTLEAMRRPLEALGYEVLDELAVLGVFEKGGVSEHAEIIGAAEASGEMLAKAILS